MSSSTPQDNFTFITETEGRSGKVSSRKARKTIRKHVMRNHWAAISSSPIQLTSAPYQEQQHTEGESEGSSSTNLNDDMVSSEHLLSPASVVLDVKTPTAEAMEFSLDEPNTFTCEHLWSFPLLTGNFSRVSNAFLRSGVSVDMNIKSYGYISHYSQEFHVIHCDAMQPTGNTDHDSSCVSAVNNHSPALLHAICCHAAAHEAASEYRTMPVSVTRSFSSASESDSNTSQTEATVWKPKTLQDCHMHALQHKTKALNLLSEFISENPERSNESIILCVVLLLAAEAVVGDSPTLNVHKNGLLRLIELYGGEESLSPGVAAQVHLTDIKAATAERRRPCFALRPYHQYNFEALGMKPYLSHDLKLKDLGSYFFSSHLTGQINVELQKCIQYSRHLIMDTEQIDNRGQSLRGYGVDDLLALEHNLLSLPFNMHLTPLEEIVRIALLVFSNTALWRIPIYFGWVVAAVGHLKASVLILDWQRTVNQYPELLMWISFIGSHGSSRNKIEFAWWIERLRAVISESGVEEWDDVMPVMQRFIFVDRVCAEDWRGIWGIATGGA